jgi:hypothetical protein
MKYSPHFFVKIALIILSGHEIDVIMGMSWMKLHKVVLDITDCLVHLSSPMYGKVTLHLPTIFFASKLPLITWWRRDWKRYIWFESS